MARLAKHLPDNPRALKLVERLTEIMKRWTIAARLTA